MLTKEVVQTRYAEGAQEKQEALCCPVDYNAELLAMLPQEIIEKDYGCGDPSRYVQEDDVVLDLGSGGGKVCYMAAELVGAKGFVHGIDMTDEMLALARKYQPEMAEKFGQERVAFHKAHIQNLALDLDVVAKYLRANPIEEVTDLEEFETWKRQQQMASPMIADASVSLVISNCVLNLVDQNDRAQLMQEIMRVLKPGGRVAISDIVCDQVVPEKLRQDPELWSGCISGAFHEKEFLQAFSDVGFVNVAYDKWEDEPWQVIEGIEFRSVTLVAEKPLVRASCQKNATLMYCGPFDSVTDAFGNVFEKGKRQQISSRDCQHLMNGSSGADFIRLDEAPNKSAKENSQDRAVSPSKCCG